MAYFNWEDNTWVKYILSSISLCFSMKYVLKINLCGLSIDKILFMECVLKKCKVCQNNPNANSIHIVIMPSTYCINDHIGIESSTHSHQFGDLLMHVVPIWSYLFHWFNIDKMSNVLVLYQCHLKTWCYNVTLTSYQGSYQ